jgi:hypothetical protein
MLSRRSQILMWSTSIGGAIGAAAGIAASMAFNEIGDFLSHLICGLEAGCYGLVPGFLWGVARIQRQTADQKENEDPQASVNL